MTWYLKISGGPEGKPDGVIDANDRQILGTEYPAWTFGANLSFGYKGINISADFQGIADAYTYGTCEYYTPTFQGSNLAILDETLDSGTSE